MAHQAAHDPAASDLRNTVKLLLPVVGVIFAAVVCYGWVAMLDPIVGAVIATIFFAVLLTALAILLARWLGTKEAARSHAKAAGEPVKARPWPLYAVLLAISAMGTINSAFYKFQGGSVLQTDIDAVSLRLDQLRSASQNVLGEPNFATRQRQLDELLLNLKQEMVNPSGTNCGIGVNARNIARQITEVLPRFRLPTGMDADRSCDVARQTARYQALETQARDLLLTGVDTVLLDIQPPLSTAKKQLADAARALSVPSQDVLERTRYFAAQQAIANGAQTYVDVRSRVANRVDEDKQALLPRDIRLDVGRSLELGSIFQLLPTLGSRIGYGSSWAYIVFAIGLDLLLVWLFRMWAEGRRTGSAGQSIRPRMADPRFLWVPPPPQSTR